MFSLAVLPALENGLKIAFLKLAPHVDPGSLVIGYPLSLATVYKTYMYTLTVYWLLKLDRLVYFVLSGVTSGTPHTDVQDIHVYSIYGQHVGMVYCFAVNMSMLFTLYQCTHPYCIL